MGRFFVALDGIIARISTSLFLCWLILFTAACPQTALCQEAIPSKKIIRSITIKMNNVFENPDYGFLYRAANEINILTKEAVLRRELLFKEGDVLNDFLLNESARNLRLQRYLRQVKITRTIEGDMVDVLVEAQETWTLIPFLNYSSGTGRRSRGVGLAESNFLGHNTRLETRYQEENSRKSVAAVYDDRQFLGTRKNLSLAAFDRNDGQIFSLATGLPFRSLLQKESWSLDIHRGDTVGRLFRNGTEDYIFRQKNEEYGIYYTFSGVGVRSKDAPDQYSGIYQGVDILSNRYTVGFEYSADAFDQADADDYESLDLDPEEVSNDPARLASDRRFSGPVLRYQKIHPNFVSMNYIDRFDRVEDYNLGDEYLFTLHAAGRMFGSKQDSFLMTGNRSRGWRFSPDDFMRGELGFSTRLDDAEVDNSLMRGELKYYNVLGDISLGDIYLGRHTFAAAIFVDFGEDLDRDRQFLVGSDNVIRGYDANTFEGDKRLGVNLEERTHIADDVLKLFSLGAAVFVDAGGATRDSLASLISDDLYSDVGFGLRFGFPRSSGGGVVRVDIAVPLRDGPDGSGQFEPRIIFGAGQLFGARLRSEQVGAQNASVGVGFDR